MPIFDLTMKFQYMSEILTMVMIPEMILRRNKCSDDNNEIISCSSNIYCQTTSFVQRSHRIYILLCSL